MPYVSCHDKAELKHILQCDKSAIEQYVKDDTINKCVRGNGPSAPGYWVPGSQSCVCQRDLHRSHVKSNPYQTR